MWNQIKTKYDDFCDTPRSQTFYIILYIWVHGLFLTYPDLPWNKTTDRRRPLFSHIESQDFHIHRLEITRIVQNYLYIMLATSWGI